MAKLKKYYVEAAKEEIKTEEAVNLLLHQMTNKYLVEQKKLFDKKHAKSSKQFQAPFTEDELKEALSQILNKFQFAIPHIKIANQPPLSAEQKLLINWNFEGINVHKGSLKLSTYFKNALNTSKNYNIANKHEPNEYDLDQIPIWNEMRKFKNFQQMSPNLRCQLANLGYDPSQLNLLNIYDVAHLIKKHNSENPKNQLQPQRTKFLRMFASCYGEEFIQKSKILGREKIAKDFIEYINYLGTDKKISDDKYADLLQANSYYSVHHKKNKQFAYELDDYSNINDFSNLALCFHEPYHTILHNPQVMDLNSNIVYFGSFRPEFQIVRNPERERQYIKGNLPINLRGRNSNE